MKEPRADHACAVVQHFYGINSKTIPPWTTGIMVSGGYRLRGAWTSSVDFLDFRTGNMKIDIFIRMDFFEGSNGVLMIHIFLCRLYFFQGSGHHFYSFQD